MVSMISNEAILIGVIGPLGTSALKEIGKTGREMRDDIVLVSDSEVLDIVADSAGKVIVTDSGRAESVELHLVLRDNVAKDHIQGSMGSKSTTQTVSSEEKCVAFAFVLGSHGQEFLKEISSQGISVFFIEILSDDAVLNGVKTVGNSLRLKDFLGQLVKSLSSTESSDDSLGIVVHEKRVGN